MRPGQRVCMGLYEATIPPGVTVRVSHCVRDACRLAALWLDNGEGWDVQRLEVDPHRVVSLAAPNREQGIWRWSVLGNWIVPGGGLASVYLVARNQTDELIALRAVVWAELV